MECEIICTEMYFKWILILFPLLIAFQLATQSIEHKFDGAKSIMINVYLWAIITLQQ